jgi:hypothetical protein
MRRTLTLLKRVTIADAMLDVPTVYTLYKCPKRRRVIIDHIRVHSNSATLAGMADINFGGGAEAKTPVWKDAADISSMTTAQMEMKLTTAGAVVIIDGDDATPANRSFMAEVVTGSTGAASVVFDIYGYMLSS